MKNKKKKGFTLIELLIVVAIIGMLATIVLLAVTRARRKANATTAKGHIAQISKALDMSVAIGCPGTATVGITAGDPIVCNPGSGDETLLAHIPGPPVNTITYTVSAGATLNNYTICAEGFPGGEKFCCQNGSCYCTTSSGCMETK